MHAPPRRSRPDETRDPNPNEKRARSAWRLEQALRRHSCQIEMAAGVSLRDMRLLFAELRDHVGTLNKLQGQASRNNQLRAFADEQKKEIASMLEAAGPLCQYSLAPPPLPPPPPPRPSDPRTSHRQTPFPPSPPPQTPVRDAKPVRGAKVKVKDKLAE